MNASEIIAFIEKLPALDLSWPDDRQAEWWKWFRILRERIAVLELSSIPTPNKGWCPLPEGDRDGSCEWTVQDGKYEGAYIRTATVILGGNDLWTAYLTVWRLDLIQKATGKSTLHRKSVHSDWMKPQAPTKEHAIQWATKKMHEAVMNFKSVSPEQNQAFREGGR